MRGILIRSAPLIEVIGQIEEECERVFRAENIADIDDPEILDPAVICGRHLLPDLRQEGGVEPLIGDRISVVIEVVIHAVSALMAAHLLCRNSTQVAEVIVAEHERYSFELRVSHKSGGLLVAIKIRLDFLIERQHSRHFVKVLIYVLFDQFVLGLKNFPKKIDIIFQRRFFSHDGGIRLAAHTDGDHVLELATADQAVFPELRDAFLIT